MQRETSSGAPRPAEPGAGASMWWKWMAARVEELRAPRAAASVRPPKRPRVRVPRAAPLRAFWAARVALRSGVSLHDFLQHRLSWHLAQLDVPAARLPLQLTVDEGGEIRDAGAPPASARRAPWLAAFLRQHGPATLAPEIQLAQAQAAGLAARISEGRGRVDALARELEEATRSAEVVDPADELEAGRMGRPPVPHPLGAALHALAGALLAAEAWQLAFPALEVAGVRTVELHAELHRNPLAVAAGALFALGAATSLFVLARVALARLLDAVDGEPGRVGGAVAVAIGVGAAALGSAMAWSLAAAGGSGRGAVDSRYAQAVVFLAALAIPATAAWLARVARRLGAERARALDAARAWDQAHYRVLAELSRRAAVAAEEGRRLADLEAQRAAAVRRQRALQVRAASAERLALDAADADEADLARAAQAVRAALELDRYEYLRQGGAPAERRATASAGAAPSAALAAAELPAQPLGFAG